MANTLTLGGRAGTVDTGTGFFERARRRLAQHRLQSSIYAELEALSDRDLADIGLVRSNLKDVARSAALAA